MGFPSRSTDGLLLLALLLSTPGQLSENAGLRHIRKRKPAGLSSLDVALALVQRKEKSLVPDDPASQAGAHLVAIVKALIDSV